MQKAVRTKHLKTKPLIISEAPRCEIFEILASFMRWNSCYSVALFPAPQVARSALIYSVNLGKETSCHLKYCQYHLSKFKAIV